MCNFILKKSQCQLHLLLHLEKELKWGSERVHTRERNRRAKKFPTSKIFGMRPPRQSNRQRHTELIVRRICLIKIIKPQFPLQNFIESNTINYKLPLRCVLLHYIKNYFDYTDHNLQILQLSNEQKKKKRQKLTKTGDIQDIIMFEIKIQNQ